jgi:membrane protein implicated in regulation of membrane protease activity
MSWSFWMISAVVLFLFEILTPGAFFFACLGIGAFFASLSVLLNPPVWFPWSVFAVVALISIYTLRPLARRLFVPVESKTNVDALIGQKALVTEAIHPPALGTLKVEGEVWRAESSEPIEAGAGVVIVAVRGTRLEVRKV